MADAAPLAVIRVGFIVSVISPPDGGVGAEEVTEPTAYAHLLIPERKEEGFIPPLKRLRFSLFEQNASNFGIFPGVFFG
jgi:hypothetical protein